METIFQGLSNLGVALLPSTYCALFLFWRYGKEKFPASFLPAPLSHMETQVVILAISILFGIFVYYFHRGVFHRVIWWVQKRVYGIPQYQFHMRVCEDLGIEGPVKKRIGISQACLFFAQIEEKEPYRASTESFNTGSHILYINSLIFGFLGVHDILNIHAILMYHTLKFKPCLVSGITFVSLALLFFLVALSYDRLADYREIVFLTQRGDKYTDIVRNLFKNHGGLSRFREGHAQERKRRRWRMPCLR